MSLLEKEQKVNQVIKRRTEEMDFEDKIELNNPNIKRLIESIKYDKYPLVIFAGAGVSKLFGLPLWNDFAKALLEDCFKDMLVDEYQIKEDYKRSVGGDSKMLITLVYNIYSRKQKEDLFFAHFNSDCY